MVLLHCSFQLTNLHISLSPIYQPEFQKHCFLSPKLMQRFGATDNSSYIWIWAFDLRARDLKQLNDSVMFQEMSPFLHFNWCLTTHPLLGALIFTLKQNKWKSFTFIKVCFKNLLYVGKKALLLNDYEHKLSLFCKEPST